MQAEPTVLEKFWNSLWNLSQARLLTLSGWIATVLGLVYSIRAFRQAERAEKAAKNAETAAKAARDQILFKNTTEELEAICLKAEEVHDFLAQDRFSEARLRTKEIVIAISEFRERRTTNLNDNDRKTLLDTIGQMQIIAATLTKVIEGALSLNAPQKARALKAIEDRAITVLRAFLGKMKDTLDRGETNGTS
jgi:hypothetical protein